MNLASGTLEQKLDRLIEAIERIAPAKVQAADFEQADCFVWDAEHMALQAVPSVNRIDINLIQGVEQVKQQLLGNTTRFAEGFSANNVLLWGARGMGKSSLVKAVQASINTHMPKDKHLKLIEINREDIHSLPALMKLIKQAPYRFILFCDDLSFNQDDVTYKSLKSALDGGIEGRPDNVIFYATSNRRHLMPREMIDNERSTAINPSEAIEEKVSLSDRFGLWLGFYKCSQDEYLAMIDSYVQYYALDYPLNQLHPEALEWATTRGNRSGRVAWQYIQDLAGRLKVAI